MAREFADLIEVAKNAPDIETALESVFKMLSERWNNVISRNDHVKGMAMGHQMGEDHTHLVDAIMDHGRVFKPVEPPARATRLSGTPKLAKREEVTPPRGASASPKLKGFNFEFDSPVRVTGTPSLELGNGDVALYNTGSGTSSLNFSYAKPHPTDPTPVVNALKTPGGSSIKDSHGKDVDIRDAVVTYQA